MTILGHTLPELRVSITELIVAAAALVAFFVQFDPGITPAVVAVAIAVIGVVAVFNVPRLSYSDVSKALMSLLAAAVALYGFFHTFHTGEVERIIAIGLAVVKVGGVFFVRNAGDPLPPV